MRSSAADVFAPVIGILGLVVLFSTAADVFTVNGELRRVSGTPAVVVRYEDVLPFSTQKPSRFGFKYPVVRYDRDGKPREESIHFARVSPGHFKIGQEVSIGRIGGRLVILDRWYIWQEHLAYILMSLAGIACSVLYYLRWRPALAAESKRPNQVPEPTTMAVTTRAPSSTARASHGRGSS
jgi:hypothetical protein